jgi:hypothetical protein
MAKQTINLGTGELTGDGESIRSALDKVNDNFDEVYVGLSELQPLFAYAFDGDYNSLTNKPTIPTDYGDHSTQGYLTSYTETDPIVGAVTGIVKADGAGNISAAVAGTDYLTTVAFADVTSTPTTVAGYGITDALALGTSSTTALAGDTALFDGAFTSLTSKPTTIAGYGITDALALGTSSTTALAGDTALFSGAFADLTSKPTTIAGYGITDALALGTSSTTALAGDTALFSGDYDDLSNKPTIPTAYTDSDVDTHLNTGSAGSNEVLSWDGADYAWVAQGGSGLQSRSLRTSQTSSLADGAEADLDITGFKAYALLFITTDRAARVRLYVTAATRTADASRAEGVDPTSDAGLIAEVITTGAETVIISPGAYGFNLESSTTTNIPCRVTNKSGSTSTVQVTLGVLQLEA